MSEAQDFLFVKPRVIDYNEVNRGRLVPRVWVSRDHCCERSVLWLVYPHLLLCFSFC